MLKKLLLPKLLREFIDLALQRLLVELEAEDIDSVVELVWADMIYPSYANVIFYVVGSKQFGRTAHCLELEQELNDIKPEALDDCMPFPNVTVECC